MKQDKTKKKQPKPVQTKSLKKHTRSLKETGIIYADCEGDARRLFHKYYNGESILTLKLKPKGWFPL